MAQYSFSSVAAYVLRHLPCDIAVRYAETRRLLEFIEFMETRHHNFHNLLKGSICSYKWYKMNSMGKLVNQDV